MSHLQTVSLGPFNRLKISSKKLMQAGFLLSLEKHFELFKVKYSLKSLGSS